MVSRLGLQRRRWRVRGLRTERLLRVAARMMNAPSRPLSLTQLANDFGVSKAVISDDISLLTLALEAEGLGRVVVDRGRSGGAYYQPFVAGPLRRQWLTEVAETLSDPHRQLPAGFLYYSDLLFNPLYSQRLGAVMATLFCSSEPTIVMTSEVKGIPLGLSTAHALGVPLALCRFRNRASDGPAVCVHYPTPTGEARAVYMGTKQLSSSDRVLIIDDFVRGGSTLQGMCQVADEFGAHIVGKGAFIKAESKKSQVPNLVSLLVLGEDRVLHVCPEAL